MKIHGRYKPNQAIHVMNRILAIVILPVFYTGIVAAQVATTDGSNAVDAPAVQKQKSAAAQECVCPPETRADKEIPAAASNTPPETDATSVGAISPYKSCRRQGRAHSNCPCNCADAPKTAEKQDYELLTGPYGGKQKPKKRN